MTKTIDVPFDVIRWEPTPYDEPAEGSHLARAVVEKRFSGPLEATGVGEGLLCNPADGDYATGAGYLVSERVTGTLEGRSGSFVLQHGGLMGGGQPPTTFGNVVPGSGTGELQGIRGTVEIDRDSEGGHVLRLSYTLG